jgi:hypothetical protein
MSSPAASISRRSHSGAVSKPFSQVGAPNSRNTRAKWYYRASATSIPLEVCTQLYYALALIGGDNQDGRNVYH